MLSVQVGGSSRNTHRWEEQPIDFRFLPIPDIAALNRGAQTIPVLKNELVREIKAVLQCWLAFNRLEVELMIPWQISFAILNQTSEALGIQTESRNLAFSSKRKNAEFLPP